MAFFYVNIATNDKEIALCLLSDALGQGLRYSSHSEIYANKP